jgi:release factor glutamine methyltransferase
MHFLKQQHLAEQRVLELGAGTAMIAIFCAKRGAHVTASEINPLAIENIRENIALNQVDVNVANSDLFANLEPDDFDLIVINPPYYPRAVKTNNDFAWFCGESFEYFRNLFSQLKSKRREKNKVYMILSEDCNIEAIQSIANENKLTLNKIESVRKFGEWNYIFEING